MGHNITLSADSYILTYTSENGGGYAGQRKPLSNGGSVLLKNVGDNNSVISFYDSGYQLQETIDFNYLISDFGNLSVPGGTSVIGGAVGGVAAFSETAADFIFYDSDGKTTTRRAVNLADIYIEKDLVDVNHPDVFTPTPLTKSSIIETTAEAVTDDAVDPKGDKLFSKPVDAGDAKNPDKYGVENVLILGLDDYLFTTLNSGVVRYRNGMGAAIAGAQLSMNEPLFRSWIGSKSYIAIGFENPKKRYAVVPDMAQARVVTYSSIQ
jgi:hypothetical protein